jgi:hypothetical protein
LDRRYASNGSEARQEKGSANRSPAEEWKLATTKMHESHCATDNLFSSWFSPAAEYVGSLQIKSTNKTYIVRFVSYTFHNLYPA